jgi:hypothetical protein
MNVGGEGVTAVVSIERTSEIAREEVVDGDLVGQVVDVLHFVVTRRVMMKRAPRGGTDLAGVMG